MTNNTYIKRTGYYGKQTDMEKLDPNPVTQFSRWYQEAIDSGEKEANAMALATVNEHALPHLRMVLMKSFSEKGICFFTNHESRKGQHIENNKNIAILFWWETLNRQVHIIGTATKLSTEESNDYFKTRDHESQIHAIVSPQSREIESLGHLKNAIVDYQREHSGEEVSCPSHWGGYCVSFQSVEFWQAGAHRLNERLYYYKENNEWKTKILAP